MIPADEIQRIAAVVVRAHRADREQGQRTGRSERIAEVGALLEHLTAARAALDALLLDGEHAEAWPGADYAADCAALRRLAQTALIERVAAERIPGRGRKRALLTAALQLEMASATHGGKPTITMMREVTRAAGVVVSDDALKKALAAVKGKKPG